MRKATASFLKLECLLNTLSSLESFGIGAVFSHSTIVSGVNQTNIQYIVDENGQNTAVTIPIELWDEIMSESETSYLLKSKTMKKRLRKPCSVKRESLSSKSVRNMEFDPHAFEDLV